MARYLVIRRYKIIFPRQKDSCATQILVVLAAYTHNFVPRLRRLRMMEERFKWWTF